MFEADDNLKVSCGLRCDRLHSALSLHTDDVRAAAARQGVSCGGARRQNASLFLLSRKAPLRIDANY
jgi:hypothetical protein